MPLVYINYSQKFLGGGDICVGQEDDTYPDHEPTRYRFEVLHATMENIGPYHDEFEMAEPIPQPIYVVAVHYSTGDTFGRSEGHGCIADIFKDQNAAEDVKRKIENESYIRSCGYNPWSGYFEQIEFVEVLCLPVLTYLK